MRFHCADIQYVNTLSAQFEKENTCDLSTQRNVEENGK